MAKQTAHLDGSARDRMLDYKFPAEPEQLHVVRAKVHHAIIALGGLEDDAQDVVIAVDEACQNIIRHAYGDTPGDIVLCMCHDGSKLIVQLRDFASPVDPDKIRPRDLDDIRPGGLGTRIMNAAMDDVSFRAPPNGETGNLLRMTRQMKLAPG